MIIYIKYKNATLDWCERITQPTERDKPWEVFYHTSLVYSTMLSSTLVRRLVKSHNDGDIVWIDED